MLGELLYWIPAIAKDAVSTIDISDLAVAVGGRHVGRVIKPHSFI